MRNEPIILKPKLFNAIVPNLLRNLLISLVIAGIIYGITFALISFKVISYSLQTLYFYLGLFIVIFSIIPLIYKIVVLSATKYYFHGDHITKELKIIKLKKHSIPYSQITDIRTHLTFWDRITKAGKLELHTAEEGIEFALGSIRDPEKIEAALHKLMSKYKSSK